MKLMIIMIDILDVLYFMKATILQKLLKFFKLLFDLFPLYVK